MRGSAMTVKISDNAAAVDHDYYWLSMATCPRNVKVQLLNPDGVAVYGKYMGEPYWQGWAPLPKRRPVGI